MRVRGAWRLAVAAFGIALAALGGFAWYVWFGLGARTHEDGTLSGLTGLHAPVHVYRDGRGVPHIRASDRHDLYFAQGYAEGADRLFQMDLLRHLVYGRLAEFFGKSALASDIAARTADLKTVFARQWQRLDSERKDELEAFSAGVNAARDREPLPFEYRLLGVRPEPWRDVDTLAAGFATALVLIDPWDDVIARDDVSGGDPKLAALLYPLSDPRYDAPIAGTPSPAVTPLPSLAQARLHAHRHASAAAAFVSSGADREASNEWAVGADRSTTGRALLANDPHLQARMPGIWYLVDLQAGSFHVAGAALAGTPGVTIGHNDSIAWGLTNGTTCSESVYADSIAGEKMRTETFTVRFGKPVVQTYGHTAHGFVVRQTGNTAYAVDWSSESNPVTPLLAFAGLASAGSIAQAKAALAGYTGPTQNFVLADRGGNAAYALAGPVPDDPLWCLGVHPANDPHYRLLPPEELPSVAASRGAIVYTANNRMYGAWPRRLSAKFSPPYRAARIRAALAGKARFGVADFAALQNETISFPDAELAREAAAAVDAKHARKATNGAIVDLLRGFDGAFTPDSRAATAAYALRARLLEAFDVAVAPQAPAAYNTSADSADVTLMLRVLRERPAGWLPDYDAFLIDAVNRTAADLHDAPAPWGEADRMTPAHPLAALGIKAFNGIPFPGRGSNYTLRVQFLPNHVQSFRAVWDVGNWDAGGITIPEGESGRPGSGHYTDQAADWNDDRLLPLPYNDKAVKAAAQHDLILAP